MPKFSGRKDVHRLYSPKSRRVDFDKADWRFLVRAAANTARAFAVVHETGCVIGDVNHGSVLVAPDMTVRLIDCDSFQVVSPGRRYLCEVGVETFTPPELQGKPFKGILRTEDHDNFGLAVMIFLTLFMGRHPFAGRYLGTGDMPISKAIEQCRFAYGIRRSDVNMERPPGTPPLGLVGPDISLLFELAFSNQLTNGGRPTAQEWAEGLAEMEKQLRLCSAIPSHWFHKASANCPWCQMEATTGVSLFPINVPSGISLFDISSFWREVESVADPGPAPTFPTIPAKPSAEAITAGLHEIKRNIVAGLVAGAIIAFAISGQAKTWAAMVFIAGVASFFLVRNLLDKNDERKTFDQRFYETSKKWQAAQAEWEKRAGSSEFGRIKHTLNELKRKWSDIPAERVRRLDQLNQNRRELQLGRFLDRFEIDDAKIEGIGAGRKRTLESYGVETAADVTTKNISEIPGFGPKLQGVLLTWRRSIEARFVFDPSRGVDAQDIAKIERDILGERQQIETKMRNFLAELKYSAQQTRNARQHLRGVVEKVQREFAQAEANYKKVRGAR
jgi:DNA-binding helix-hairpin-helix protein with protein kinase domain